MLSKIIKWLNGENYNAKAARELAANLYIYLATDLPGLRSIIKSLTRH